MESNGNEESHLIDKMHLFVIDIYHSPALMGICFLVSSVWSAPLM